ncbi:MAG: hypothetical protein KDA32_08865 [Phycisphaerales bacterium]|nr:hypothetical protein [Phycisphaerales bacterium]
MTVLAAKHARQTAIRALLESRQVASQLEIVDDLIRNGHDATQASVSRDIRELGFVKLNGVYVSPKRIAPTVDDDGAAGLSSELVISSEPIGANLVLIRTGVGAASVVAAEVDQLGLKEIAGTVAGDDTILIVVRSRAAQGRVMASLGLR